jgi:hypothetical protein
MVSQLGIVRINGSGSELRVRKLNVASSLLLTLDLRSRVHVTLRLTVHKFSTSHPNKQIFLNCNNLVINIKNIYGVQFFIKLSSCYLEHLDSFGLRHANRLRS